MYKIAILLFMSLPLILLLWSLPVWAEVWICQDSITQQERYTESPVESITVKCLKRPIEGAAFTKLPRESFDRFLAGAVMELAQEKEKAKDMFGLKRERKAAFSVIKSSDMRACTRLNPSTRSTTKRARLLAIPAWHDKSVRKKK